MCRSTRYARKGHVGAFKGRDGKGIGCLLSVALKSLMTRELAAKSIFRSARISCTTFLLVVVIVFVIVVVAVVVVVVVFI